MIYDIRYVDHHTSSIHVNYGVGVAGTGTGTITHAACLRYQPVVVRLCLCVYLGTGSIPGIVGMDCELCPSS